MKILIRTCYETWTPEDFEIGDTDDRGIESEHTLTMDDHQDEEDPRQALIDAAADAHHDAGACYPSMIPVDPAGHLWWSTPDPDENYTTGEKTYRSVHMEGPDELIQDVHRELARRAKIETR